MAKKKQQQKTPKIPGTDAVYVSPFSSGLGGGHFELKVAVYYLAGLLSGEVCRGTNNGLIQLVRLQQRNRGYLVDDVVCDIASENQISTFSLQIKHGIRLTEKNTDFQDAIEQCWQQFNGNKFNEAHDRVGLGFDEASNIEKIRKNFPDLLTWAQTSESSEAFFEKLIGFKVKSEYLAILRIIVTKVSKKSPSNDQLWRFLKCFVAIPFDLENGEAARDQTSLIQSLRPFVTEGTPIAAARLADQLYAIAAEYAKSGGELTLNALLQRLGPEVAARIPAARRAQTITLRNHLRSHVQKELQKQSSSGKFIDNLFTETSDSKDCARNLLDPIFYFEKASGEIPHLNLTHFNRMRREYQLPTLQVPSDITTPQTLLDVPHCCDKALAKLGELSDTLNTPPGNENNLDDHTKYVLEKRWHSTGGWYINKSVDRIRRHLQALKCSVLLVLSDAGRGKTNFLCDLAQFQLRLDIPGAFFTGKSLECAQLDDLEDWMLRQLVPNTNSKSDAYQAIERLCQEVNRPCIILIDAINEHSSLQQFSVALEQCIGQMTSNASIRFVLSCRSEFFEARFGGFSTASFQKNMLRIDRLNEQMSPQHAHRMFDSYLQAFCLRVTMSDNCRQDLERNPLLLRIFCETYGHLHSSEPIQLPHINNIYKDRLFQKYLDLKLAAVSDRANERNNSTLFGKVDFLNSLFGLIERMFSKNNFSSVALADLESQHKQALEQLLYEELLLRKDLEQALHSVEREVLVFPFDELRDFLIAKYLVEVVWQKDQQEFLAQANSVLTANKTIAEGVSRCLFFVAKRHGHHALYDLVRNEKWFESTFVESIFAIEEDLIKPDDLREIRKRFQDDPSQRINIAKSLINRSNEAAFHTLNIQLLFDLLRDMDDDLRDKLTDNLFGHVTEFGFDIPQSWSLRKLAEEIRDARPRLERSHFGNLVQLLLYLINVTENHYDYPAKDALVSIFEEDFDLGAEELARFTKESPSINIAYVVDALADIAERLQRTSPDFHQFAIEKWNGVCDPRTTGALLQYFDACKKIDAKLVPDSATKQLQRKRQEMKQFLERY
ncbi:hypothetical protein GC197_05515 [bacterium]|nr:hypothetical protein [bacterium]